MKKEYRTFQRRANETQLQTNPSNIRFVTSAKSPMLECVSWEPMHVYAVERQAM